MGGSTVRAANEGFFTRLGHAIDAFNANGSRTSGAAPRKPVDTADVKPLPKKYAASHRHVVHSLWGNYATKALKLADDMRALAVKEDHFYNRTTPKDVDNVLTKYKPLLAATNATAQRNAIAKLMVNELRSTPTGQNLIGRISTPLYQCSTIRVAEPCSASGYKEYEEEVCGWEGESKNTISKNFLTDHACKRSVEEIVRDEILMDRVEREEEERQREYDARPCRDSF